MSLVWKPTATAITTSVLFLIVGCGSSNSDEGAATTTATTTTATTTTAAPATVTPSTVAATTTTDATTTVLVAIDFTLRGDGLGPYDFGSPYEEMIDALTGRLGDPETNSITEYIPDESYGYATDEDIPTVYDYPVGRSVCWSSGFCAEFGGDSESSLFLTGWSHSCFECDPSLNLRTESGLTAGSRGSENPEIVVQFAQGGGCQQLAIGEDVDGISLYLQSVGAPFVVVDAAGNEAPNTPDPADVVVAHMETVGVPSYVGGDCANFIYTLEGLF